MRCEWTGFIAPFENIRATPSHGGGGRVFGGGGEKNCSFNYDESGSEARKNASEGRGRGEEGRRGREGWQLFSQAKILLCSKV